MGEAGEVVNKWHPAWPSHFAGVVGKERRHCEEVVEVGCGAHDIRVGASFLEVGQDV